MTELHIGRQLVEARHKMKITQQELADYMGVSKAAVSKWESGLSFPDITFLPKLATFYNISIDNLLGYEPQLTKEQIKQVYHDLKKRFSEEPWDVVYEECQTLEKEYYSCFPLLLQLLILYINHANLAKDPMQVILHCIQLGQRIEEFGEDARMRKEASNLVASCYLLTGKPEEALDLLDQEIRPDMHEEELLVQTYMSLGRMEEAKTVIQISTYQHLITMLSDLTGALYLYQEEARCMEIIHRGEMLIETFSMAQLNPNVVVLFYTAAAKTLVELGKIKEALEMLNKYLHICQHSFFPYQLRGDAFFDRIAPWFQNFDLGNQAPRSEELIKQSIVSAIENNPVFQPLQEETEYQRILRDLKRI